MLLLVRFFIIILRSFFRPRIGALEDSIVRFTVLPHDCDLNFHLNGGRFISFMGISRVELLGRIRLLRPMLRRRWRPVMAGVMVRFRRSVLPFQRFAVRSRILGWDEKWFYIQHIVEKDGELCATGYARGVIRDGKRNVPPAEVLSLLKLESVESPPLPQAVALWREAEESR